VRCPDAPRPLQATVAVDASAPASSDAVVVAVVVPQPSYGQRQCAEHNPHSEHAEDVWIFDG